MLTLILLVFGFVLLAVSAFWNPPRISLLSLGLACWCLSLILSDAHIH